MKKLKPGLVISMAFLMTASCNEPKTVVTNIVHPDGSVTRKIEMKSSEKNFRITNVQVPCDSTWTVRDSLEIGEKGDTLWVKRAEKTFTDVEEINLAYKSDSGLNKNFPRHAEFKKRFRWFNTEYTFKEIIDKNMHYGYPVSDFLDSEELKWFYYPDSHIEKMKNGPDSIKYRALNDTVDKKVENWMIKSLVSEWIAEFSNLLGENSKNELSAESLMNNEDRFVTIVKKYDEKFDSLWSNGIILKEFIGEASAIKYKTQADSAVNISINRLLADFRDYTLRTIMPGKVTEMNGMIDSSGVLMWPVKSDYFLTQTYEMKAVSKVPNIWAWIVSGVFISFVIYGAIIRKRG